MFKNIIGKGIFATVYGLDKNPYICIKKTNKKNNCSNWSNEYNKIRNIHKILDGNKKYKNLKFIKIIDPLYYYETKDGNFYMGLNRIYNPYKIKELKFIRSKHLLSSCNKLHKNYLTINALFGETNASYYKSSLRGKFIGLDEILKYYNNDEIKKVSYELGKAMALIHFIAKNDATNIELYIGREYGTRITKIYICDFDLSNEITHFDNYTIDKICWCFDAMPYFPSSTSNKNLYNLFKKGYKKIANNDEIVEKIFNIYK